jgi:hypothetical protein
MQIDRHIAISAGWVAGPAFGVAMMAAPDYLHPAGGVAAALFWGGLAVFFLTLLPVFILSLERVRRVGPLIVIAIGLTVTGAGVAWYFWPQRLTPASMPIPEDSASNSNASKWAWPVPNSQNMALLTEKLKQIPDETIAVASVPSAGSDLADALQSAFLSSGHKNVPIKQPFEGMIGKSGVIVFAANDMAKNLSTILESADIKPTSITDRPNTNVIVVTIGARAFPNPLPPEMKAEIIIFGGQLKAFSSQISAFLDARDSSAPPRHVLGAMPEDNNRN